MAQRHVPGAAWGVIVDGQVAHLSAKGLRDVDADAPVDGDSVFRIASMTKSFTAMSILELRDEGKLSLDDPAERYVPEMAGLKYPTTDAPKITIRHLLSHAEGFPEDNPWGDRQLADTDEQLSQMLRTGIPFSNAPGIAYEYSNLGFAILGRIVDQRLEGAVHRVREREHPAAARHDLDDAGAGDGGGEPAGARLPLGRRALEERAAAVERIVRLDGRHADVGPRSEPLRRAVPRRRGRRTTVRRPAPIRRSSLREMQHLWSPVPSSVTRNARPARSS